MTGFGSAPELDAIVVGAGPAGASTAFHLASRGQRVLLLDRSAFPRDKSCGDAVTQVGVGLLAEMGALELLPNAWRVHGLRVSMGTHPARDFRDDPGTGESLVVPRTELDEVLVRLAVKAGAQLREGTKVRGLITEDGVVRGVETGGGELRARVVVAADGAASLLSRQAGLTATAPGRLGYALRTYVDDVEDLDDLLEFAAPLVPRGSRRWLPSYGWAFPLGGGRANIGVGLVEKSPRARTDELMTLFLDRLRDLDPRFTRMRQTAPWRGAPLRFDFAPERCWKPGLVLVGDAAGMISPFTGEGISFALESGKIAAESICSDVSGYAGKLGHRFQSYFETGRRATTRHRLVWHVLDDTFGSERPLFALTRRAALAPEGMAGFGAAGMLTDVRACLHPELGIASDLAEVGELLADTVRPDWPFLTRLPGLWSPQSQLSLRPALLVLLCSRLGRGSHPDRARLAAAVELAGLAALAQEGVPESSDHPQRPAWGTMFSVLTTDVLLARALELCLDSGLVPELAQLVEESCATQLRLARAKTPTLDLVLETGPAALFAAACELGARTAGAPAEVSEAVRDAGRALGACVQLADDTARLLGRTDRLGRDARADAGGAPSYPLLLAARHDPTLLAADLPAEELVRRSRCTPLQAEVDALIQSLADSGQERLSQLPDRPAAWSLAELLKTTHEL